MPFLVLSERVRGGRDSHSLNLNGKAFKSLVAMQSKPAGRARTNAPIIFESVETAAERKQKM